jgi:NADH:ubiquinone oxidoreductase subunit F (NADH-binding)
MDILSKIREVKLSGCGGACFPTADKWQAVKDSFAIKKYVICNSSEGEPDVKKDGYMWNLWPEKVIGGMDAALEFLSERSNSVEGFIFINYKYANLYGKKIKAIIAKRNLPIKIFIKPPSSGYIAGEETTILNIIEGKKAEPRLKPPYPTVSGLWGYPTIINNVETFYHIAKIEAGTYENFRFYTISGDCDNPGVYKLPAGKTAALVLRKTGNWPALPFFVQIGGGASGEVLAMNQLDTPVTGAMSLTVYRADNWYPEELLRHWVGFFMSESCGQCTPCREGTYRLFEIINSKRIDWQLVKDILDNLGESSFCGLGLAAPIAIKSYIKNVVCSAEYNIDFKDKEEIFRIFK